MLKMDPLTLGRTEQQGAQAHGSGEETPQTLRISHWNPEGQGNKHGSEKKDKVHACYI